jgi:hypothetical protein
VSWEYRHYITWLESDTASVSSLLLLICDADEYMIHAFLQVATAASVLGSGVADPASGPAGERYTGTAAELEVRTPSVESAGVDIDGRLEDAVWAQAALLDGFTQFDPVEGSEASQRTEVMVIVDSDAIYFGIRAFDEDPSGIRATLAARDSYIFSDDYIRVVLDTFNDQRRAYVFTVNPLGVQHDGLWNEGGGGAGHRGGFSSGSFGSPIDQNPDFLWDSEGNLTEWGYEAEIRIPFKSLRFPELDEQSWGLQVERKIQRNGYTSSWAPITGNIANKLTQTGTLTGLRNLDMGLFLELNPVLTGSRNGSVDDLGDFSHDSPTGDFGFNATYGLTSNLTLDGTYNPDFSQVEADAGQVQVNERFALFFAEKRPFFLEGTEIFGLPKQLVYTRTIANPIAGGKMTGKVGGLNVGYLGAVDQAFDDGGPDTYVNLVRVRGDLGASSTIGAVYTDRTIDAGDFNRVAGADARIQLGGRYTFTFMGAQSFTNNSSFLGRTDARMGYARVERAGRTFSINADFEDTQPDFDPGSGFFQRVGTAQATSRSSYNWYGSRGSLIEQISPSVEAKGYWDHDALWSGGGLEESEFQASTRFSLRGNISLWVTASRRMYEFQPEQYEGLFVGQTDGSFQPFLPDQGLFGSLGNYSAFIWVNKWQRVRGNIRYSIGDAPIFDRSFGVAVEPARSYSTRLSFNLYPTRALAGEIGVTHSRLVRKRDGVEHSNAVIPRVRGQYQFSRALFFRGIVEYGSQERADLMDPVTGLPLSYCDGTDCSARAASVSNDFRVEGLIGYEPSPGTVFFLGYTREMEDATAFGFENVRPTADGLFVKLSYRFRR